MTPEQIAEAEARLAQRPEFRWLAEAPDTAWFNVTEAARHIGIAASTMRKLCERGDMPGSIYYGPDIGWRIPRSGLVEYLARAIGYGQHTEHAS